MKRKYIISSITLIIILLLDRGTKLYVSSIMLLHDSFPVIDGFFSITYIRNPGAAFGFLANASHTFLSLFFVVVSAIAIVLLLLLIKNMKDEQPLFTFSLSLILGGAVGNLIDRVCYGEVIDFLDLHLMSYHWPAFNVADTSITVGAVILVYQLIVKKREVPGVQIFKE